MHVEAPSEMTDPLPRSRGDKETIPGIPITYHPLGEPSDSISVRASGKKRRIIRMDSPGQGLSHVLIIHPGGNPVSHPATLTPISYRHLDHFPSPNLLYLPFAKTENCFAWSASSTPGVHLPREKLTKE